MPFTDYTDKYKVNLLSNLFPHLSLAIVGELVKVYSKPKQLFLQDFEKYFCKNREKYCLYQKYVYLCSRV